MTNTMMVKLTSEMVLVRFQVFAQVANGRNQHIHISQQEDFFRNFFFEIGSKFNFKNLRSPQKSRKPLKQCVIYILSFLRRLRMIKISNFGTRKNLVSRQTQGSNFAFKRLLQRVRAPSSCYFGKKEGCARIIAHFYVLIRR